MSVDLRPAITSPIHLNRNVFAAIYATTTGPLVGFHDVYEVCILPLDSKLDFARGVSPFLVRFKPLYDEHPDLNRELYIQARASGIMPSKAPDILEFWFNKLALPKGKKLCPVSWNWQQICPFLKQLFGPTLFEEVFFEVPRDLMNVAAYINDCCDLNVLEIPFPKYGIQSICNRLSVEIDMPKDALNLCKACARAYKASLKRMFKGTVM